LIKSAHASIPESFFEDDLITDVLHVVKSGKEATVYCCQAHPSTGAELLAAKVYRPREVRSFKNDAVYQQGRVIGGGRPDRRLQRAVRNKSRKGRQEQFADWVSQEFQCLRRLSAAGADVPRPLGCSGSAILIEYIGDRHAPAPQLVHVTLAQGEVRPLFARILRNVEICLACDLIHGDLSAFNILYWNGDVKIIDFPQSVNPHVNRNAFSLLVRDLENVCQYFAAYGIEADPYRLVRQVLSRVRQPAL
jgi:RIO kinase 1